MTGVSQSSQMYKLSFHFYCACTSCYRVNVRHYCISVCTSGSKYNEDESVFPTLECVTDPEPERRPPTFSICDRSRQKRGDLGDCQSSGPLAKELSASEAHDCQCNSAEVQ